jgi:hypothetical protein
MSLEINVRHTNCSFNSVKIIEGQTTIDLGLLDDRERDDLANIFINAIYEMGPRGHGQCEAWLNERLTNSGIDLKEAINAE